MDLNVNNDFRYITELINRARHDALKSVNKELINLYWKVGEYISIKVKSEKWGKSVVFELSDFIRNDMSGIKGFSSQNI